MSEKAAWRWDDHAAGAVIAVVVLAVVLWVLMATPMVGVANNGDFWRVMRPVGLTYINEHLFTNVSPSYGITPQAPLFQQDGYLSSQLIPVELAIALNKLIHSSRVFDIRFLGLFYALVHAGALGLLFSVNRGGNSLSTSSWWP